VVTQLSNKRTAEDPTPFRPFADMDYAGHGRAVRSFFGVGKLDAKQGAGVKTLLRLHGEAARGDVDDLPFDLPLFGIDHRVEGRLGVASEAYPVSAIVVLGADALGPKDAQIVFVQFFGETAAENEGPLRLGRDLNDAGQQRQRGLT